jgi:hypothetical protein
MVETFTNFEGDEFNEQDKTSITTKPRSTLVPKVLETEGEKSIK